MTTPEPYLPTSTPPAWRGWAVFCLVAIATFALGLLVASVLERRKEAARPPVRTVPIAELEPDNAIWGTVYPREYQSWLKTAEGGTSTKYGGPVPFSQLERDPHLSSLFAGYPFAVEYNEERGHQNAIKDVTQTRRVDPARGGKKQPGTCLTCKSSEVPGLMRQMGVAEFYHTPFDKLKKKVSHPIGCADCHDAKTMNLRISRPALREAFTAMGKNIDHASQQEMRSLVCAQCHVEYYFAKKNPAEKKGTYLTFPWKRGTRIEDIEAYFTKDVPHVDWTHPVSGTKMIKMQHPDYEIYRTGVHAARGVACADCHMPYRTEGGVKYTDHHIQSPLKDISNACAVCHHWTEAEVLTQVETIQDRNNQLLLLAESALVAAHQQVGAAMKAGATDAQLKEARELIRSAQMRWDFVAANNGMGFHSPQECARILATALDRAGKAQLAVSRLKMR